MKIVVVGTGYVGLVTGACFSEMGNEVVCVDVDEEKINNLKNNIIPIYEPGLKELIDNNHPNNLTFSLNLDMAVKKANIVFIAVGTPMGNEGKADLSDVYKVAEDIGKAIDNYKIIVTKSTVPVGTTEEVRNIIGKEISKRNLVVDFDMASNPEFLKEGAAVSDFMKPDRIVIGADKEKTFSLLKKLYSSFFRTRERFITMDIQSAEMTKYAANAMLATKISFINEIANICEKVGANVNEVRIGIGSDTRIGYDFIYPGIGYGGTCFPKDIIALIQLGKENGYEPKLISAVNEVNEKQKDFFLNKITDRFGEDLTGLTFAVWGLSFKPETDDMREAPSVYIINMLLKKGAHVKVYDPKAMEVSKNMYFKENTVFYASNKYEAIEAADAILLLTEWKEFRLLNFSKIKESMKNTIIFDGRNQYSDSDFKKNKIEYYQIGKKC